MIEFVLATVFGFSALILLRLGQQHRRLAAPRSPDALASLTADYAADRIDVDEFERRAERILRGETDREGDLRFGPGIAIPVRGFDPRAIFPLEEWPPDAERELERRRAIRE